jgi:hypothetical protein
MDRVTTKDGTQIEPLARRRLLVGAVTLLLVAGAPRVGAAAKPTITVHKSPT